MANYKIKDMAKLIEAPEGVRIVTIIDKNVGSAGCYTVYKVDFSADYKYIFVKTDTNGVIVAYSDKFLDDAASMIFSQDCLLDKNAPGMYLLDKTDTMCAAAGDVRDYIYIAVPHFGFEANIRVMATNSPICPFQ